MSSCASHAVNTQLKDPTRAECSVLSTGKDDGIIEMRTVIIDSSFTQAVTKSILEGLETWMRATRGRVLYTNVSIEPHSAIRDLKFKLGCDGLNDDTVFFMAVTSSDKDIVEHDSKNGDSQLVTLAIAKSICRTSTIKIAVDRVIDKSEDVQIRLVVHELGHTLGLDHVDEDGASIMHSVITRGARCVTKQDLEHLCRTNDCD